MSHIPVLDGEKKLEDVIREGMYAQALRNNPAFESAVRELYYKYTLAEDNVTATNDGDADKNRYQYSMLRLLLTELVLQLDDMVQEKENAEYNNETNGEV